MHGLRSIWRLVLGSVLGCFLATAALAQPEPACTTQTTTVASFRVTFVQNQRPTFYPTRQQACQTAVDFFNLNPETQSCAGVATSPATYSYLRDQPYCTMWRGHACPHANGERTYDYTTSNMQIMTGQAECCQAKQGDLVNAGDCVNGACASMISATSAQSLGRLCVNQCAAAGNVMETGTLRDGTGYALYIGTRYTGSTCGTTEKPSVLTPQNSTTTCGTTTGGGSVACVHEGKQPPKGTCYAQLNGQPVYAECATTESTATSSITPSTTALNSLTVPQKDVTTTRCNGGVCTSTTTSTVSGAPTTTVRTQDQSSFCTDNPNHRLCKQANGIGEESEEPTPSEFGGSCTGGFTCSGDAAQCAAARGVWESRCALKALEGETSNAAYQAGLGAISGAPPAQNPRANPDSIGLVLNQTNPYSATCPPDITLNLAGKQIVIGLASRCGSFQLLGNLLVALALLAAAGIVIRGQ